jgi:hypothetical protein
MKTKYFVISLVIHGLFIVAVTGVAYARWF